MELLYLEELRLLLHERRGLPELLLYCGWTDCSRRQQRHQLLLGLGKNLRVFTDVFRAQPIQILFGDLLASVLLAVNEVARVAFWTEATIERHVVCLARNGSVVSISRQRPE